MSSMTEHETMVTPSAALSPMARRLLHLLRHDASAAAPVTQLDAGHEIGLTGADDTVRRQVQRLRDEINGSGRAFVCSSWAGTHGMWATDDPAEIDEYVSRVLARALTTIKRFRRAERRIRLRIAADVQGVLDLRDEPEVRARTNSGESMACLWCGDEFAVRAYNQVYCSTECRMKGNGR